MEKFCFIIPITELGRMTTITIKLVLPAILYNTKKLLVKIIHGTTDFFSYNTKEYQLAIFCDKIFAPLQINF